MSLLTRLFLLVVLAGAAGASLTARQPPTAPKTPRVYIFDNGKILKTAPGHTPGHQVFFLRLAKRGPVVLAGDLYHYPEEIATGRTPSFEWNADQSKATRVRIAAFLKQTGAEMWIEHDIATHAKLPKAPAYVE